MRIKLTNEMRNEMKNEMKNEMRNNVLSEDKALSAVVDFTSSFLMRVVSIFSRSLHSTRNAHHIRLFKFEIKFVEVRLSSI
jgi:uncharacterized protein (UPF0218 family)